MASVTQEQPPGKRATKTPVIFDADEQEALQEAELATAHAEAMKRLKAETLKVPWTLTGIGRAAMIVNKRIEKVKLQEDAQADDVNDETCLSSGHSSDYESEMAEFIDRDDEAAGGSISFEG